MRTADEIRRIERGPEPDEVPKVIDRVEFSGDASTILDRAKSVLVTVLSRVDDWPADNVWPALLPAWFVSACAPEWTAKEAEVLLARWWRLTDDEKALSEEREPWSLLNWLHWFNPSGDGKDRSWSWWAAGSDGDGAGWLDVEIDGHPYASGALHWLLRASGATSLS